MSEMSEAEVLAEFRAAGALLTGPFRADLGPAQPFYLQCARVLMDPARPRGSWQRSCPRSPRGADLVVAPALGGIVLGYEVGRQLACPRSSSSAWTAASRCGAASRSRRAAGSWSPRTWSRPACRPANASPAAGRRAARSSAPPASSTAAAARPSSACRWLPGHARPADLPAAQAAGRARGDPRRQARLARPGRADGEPRQPSKRDAQVAGNTRRSFVSKTCKN